ncbi:MAG: energy transducer TonB [Geopsychrobacter sp.]|nr:energy transducer TonB [Geopsychrobacter sp.]
MQGILLLKITVDTKGELLDVELMKSSGSDLLDYEAIQAVYRAAPFGPLGKHYPHPELKIMAHFRYMLSGKYIYGKRR